MIKLISSELQEEIWYTIRHNKKRTLFTALGVFAGMFFFTLLTGFGTGIQNAINHTLSGSASNLYYVFTGRTTLPYQGYRANREVSINYADFLELDRRKANLDIVACYAIWGESEFGFATPTVKANGKSRGSWVAGISEKSQLLSTNIVVHGRDLRLDEIVRGEPLCLIGARVVKNFFDNPEDAVGQYLNIDGIPLKIVGVVKPVSDNVTTGYNINWTIQVPITFTVQNRPTTPVFLNVIPKEGVTSTQIRDEVFEVISANHHVSPDDREIVQTIGMETFLDIFRMISTIILILVWIIGLGTLFTGVISVSNVLLVTVRERQREIGVRRALGAKPEDIRDQFMLEALFIILIAGFSGLLIGLLGTIVAGVLSEQVESVRSVILRPYPEPWVLLFSLIIMVIAGILAGLLPVFKALQIKAIDAIREE